MMSSRWRCKSTVRDLERQFAVPRCEVLIIRDRKVSVGQRQRPAVVELRRGCPIDHRVVREAARVGIESVPADPPRLRRHGIDRHDVEVLKVPLVHAVTPFMAPIDEHILRVLKPRRGIVICDNISQANTSVQSFAQSCCVNVFFCCK